MTADNWGWILFYAKLVGWLCLCAIVVMSGVDAFVRVMSKLEEIFTKKSKWRISSCSRAKLACG